MSAEEPISPREDEQELYRRHPAMFRAHPFWFALAVLLIAAFGVGLVILLIWWIKTLATTLIITNKRTTLLKGLLSRHTNEVLHANVRNVQIHQSFFNRLLDVGTIGISSAGQADVEIEEAGIPHPMKVKELIDPYREM